MNQVQGLLRPIPLRPKSLGQAILGPFKVIVVDANGHPISDVDVQVMGGPSGKTDSHGIIVFDGINGSIEVHATYKDLTIAKKLSANEVGSGLTAFLQFQIIVSDPLIRPMDLVILGSAGLLIGAGAYFKVKPLEMIGEIAIGAAIFSLIYRLQGL